METETDFKQPPESLTRLRLLSQLAEGIPTKELADAMIISRIPEQPKPSKPANPQ